MHDTTREILRRIQAEAFEFIDGDLGGAEEHDYGDTLALFLRREMLDLTDDEMGPHEATDAALRVVDRAIEDLERARSAIEGARAA